ncbi:iron complex transport system substrate-binding protein [Methanococcus voltae]|uniref:ABC transporter substrate-binding protein n=1 Tax=Methanococcus voltae TaxID=2188 RepID=UPI001AE520B8|nr:ABC transporter substrate-binding protein [Methanococcus voltae]MBP2144411.1 iron complex transport system substrate-binding protein [Methanococcus voltae]
MSKALKKSFIMAFNVLMITIVAMSCGCIGDSTESTNDIKSNEGNNNLDPKGLDADKSTEYITVTDMAGRTVQVPKNVSRVIGLGCCLREIVYLDAADKVVGVEVAEGNKNSSMALPYVAANPELTDLPVVGKAGSGYYYEKIIAANPDMIFLGYQADLADEIQKKIGVPVVVVFMDTTGSEDQNEKYAQSLRVMGKVLGKEERADAVVNKLEEYKNDLKTRASKSDKNPTTYIGGRVYSGGHGITTTDPHWMPFEYLGANNRANNVAYNISKTGKVYSVSDEQLVTWNPEYLFINSASMDLVLKDLERPEFGNLDAVKNGKTYRLIPYCWYGFNKASAIADSYYIGKVLYPEQFEDIDPVEKADEVYTFFTGKPAYEGLSNKNLGFEKLEDL